MAAGTLQDVKATIIQRCTRGLFARNIYREKKAHRERQVLAQTIISAPWRGGVVRMRNNRRELEAEARDDEVDAKLNDETKTKNEDNNGGKNAVEEEVQEETKT